MATFKYVEFLETGKTTCIRHGVHDKWRVKKYNAIHCKKCEREELHRRHNRRRLKYLAKWTKLRCPESEITEEDLIVKFHAQDKKCALSRIPFNEVDCIPSIDRINSAKGYTVDNVQLVLIEVNRMKSDFPQHYFIHLCKQIAENS